ncbi:hypothetical protein BKA63DRAFT_526250 [Paraphoma chrysanthemicola]|nr:hypothetical protein BKA63DRAFT_526250 [Paraphoma chrysanthemicola]
MFAWLSSPRSALRRPFNAVAAITQQYKEASQWFWKARVTLRRLAVTGVTGSPFLFEVAPNPVIFSHLGTAGVSAVMSRFAHVPIDLESMVFGLGPVQRALVELDELENGALESLTKTLRLRHASETIMQYLLSIWAETGCVTHNNRDCTYLVTSANANGLRRYKAIAMAENFGTDQDLRTNVADVVRAGQEDKIMQGADLTAPKRAMDIETIHQFVETGTDEAPSIRELSAQSDMATVPRSQSTCPHCSVDLPTWRSVRRHINRKHIRRFKCLQGSCESAFHLKADLQRHHDSVHQSSTSARGFSCANSWCMSRGKLWPRKDNFERHAKRCKQG